MNEERTVLIDRWTEIKKIFLLLTVYARPLLTEINFLPKNS